MLPSIWTQSIIKPIPKGSDKDPCVPLNYRGISLISCVSKIMSGILNNRLCNYDLNHNIIVEEQNGFRKKRSCAEHVFVLTSIIRKRKFLKLPTYVAFIDLQKAFDHIDRDLMLFMLLSHGIDGKLYKVIKAMYSNTKSCLKVNNLTTKWFDVRCGVRQGDNLSPTLFNYFINDLATVIKNLNRGVLFGKEKVSILLYADDMVLLAQNEFDLQLMLNSLHKWCVQWRVNVNCSKSNIVHFRPPSKQPTHFIFKYDTKVLERVSDYKYLGVCLDECLNYKKCSSILADSAGRALGGIISKFKNLKDCGFKTFTKLFDAGVIPILNYGAEIWGHGNYPKCDYIMNRAMRFFLGVHRFAPTTGVQGDMGWMSLKYRRYISILRFWNRLQLMDENRLTKRIFSQMFDNPENSWCNDVKNIASSLGMLDIYSSKGQFNLPSVLNKCQELMSLEWKEQITSKPKLRTYIKFKSEFKTEPYVSKYLPKNIRSLVAQLRLGILPLKIETGRFTNIMDPDTQQIRKMNINERTCNICNTHNVEDEYHFLLVCEKYAHERNQLLNDCITDRNFHILSSDEKLICLLVENWKLTASYIYKIWSIRRDLIYVA